LTNREGRTYRVFAPTRPQRSGGTDIGLISHARRAARPLPLALVAAIALAAPAAARADAADVLLRRPFAPTDRALFTPGLYPGTPPLVPAGGGALTEADVRRKLARYLAKEYPRNRARRAAALRLFESARLSRRVPSASLRAAIVALRPTIGRPALRFYRRSKRLVDVRFGAVSDPAFVAEMFIEPESGDMHVHVNERFRGENPFLFTSLLGHEPLHSDLGEISDMEEAVAYALDQIVYLQQLARHPRLARTGTELARRRNAWAIIRLNSGIGSGLDLFRSIDDRPVIPDSPHRFTSWWDVWLARAHLDLSPTPGNKLLRRYLKRIAGHGKGCKGREFDARVLRCVSDAHHVLDPDALVAAARALALDAGA
jgi:hypothetical protein